MSTHTASMHPLQKMRAKFDKLLADKNTRTYVLVTLFALLVIVTAAVVAILLQSRDVGVAGETATLKLTPGTGNLTPGTSQTLSLKANISTAAVDGFQVFIDFTGTVPSNLSFQGSTIPGLNLVTGSISNSTNGKTLSLLFITSVPTTPFTVSGDVELGKLTFTVPASGQMVATFNTSLTKIIQNPGGTNIVAAPAVTTYTFAAPASSSSSSSSSSSTSSVTTTTTPTSIAPCTAFNGSYFNNATLTGSPAANRCDTAVDFNWGNDAPITGVNADNFSVRWTGNVNIATAGTYKITTYSDDGVRVYADNQLVVDNWVDNNGSVPVVVERSFSAGNHSVVIEYYEKAGGAKIQFLVERVVTSSSSASTTTSVSTTITTNTSSSSTTTSTSTGLVCGLIDVDGNTFLDITDFAAFAAKYNKVCTSQSDNAPTVSYDYAPGQTVELDIKLENLGNNNAVDVDLNVVNATVLGFTPTTATGWLGGIGYCNAQGATFTSSKVCIAMSKQTDIIAGEVVGKIRIQNGAAGTTTIDRTGTFAYSNGTTKTNRSGNLYTLSIGNSTGGTVSICGRQDNNSDNLINIVDFSSLGRKYRKTNCGV